jgi:hypothetical protein
MDCFTSFAMTGSPRHDAWLVIARYEAIHGVVDGAGMDCHAYVIAMIAASLRSSQ